MQRRKPRGQPADALQRAGRAQQIEEEPVQPRQIERHRLEGDFLQHQPRGPRRVILAEGNFAVALLLHPGQREQSAADRGGASVQRPAPGLPRQRLAGEPHRGEAEVAIAREAAQIGGQEIRLRHAAARLADEAAEVAEVGERADRPAVARPAGRAAALGGLVHRELELVVTGGAPRVHAFGPQLAGEFLHVAVHCENPLWPHALHALQQPGVVGVVGKRENFIHPVAVFRARLQRPAGEHRGALRFQPAQQLRADRIRRGDDDMPGRRVTVEDQRLRQRLHSGGAAGHRHRRDRGMQQRRDAMLGHQRQRFLRFSQRITEQHRRLPVRKCILNEAQNAGLDLHRVRELEGRQAEGRFQDQRVCGEEIDSLRGPPAAGFEVAGVEQARVVLEARHMQHRRAGDVPGRQQPQPETVAHHRHMERHRGDPALRQVEARVDQRRRHVRAQRGIMAGEVVRMGMGNEGPRLRVPRVQPQVELRQMQAALEAHFNQSAPLLNPKPPAGQEKRHLRSTRGLVRASWSGG